jgi:FkbM family methyltransferase
MGTRQHPEVAAIGKFRTQQSWLGDLKSGDLCFDVGAGFGVVTDALLAIGATVIAVEPQPICVAELRRRFGTSMSVSIEPKAVAATTGECKLYICGPNPELTTTSLSFIRESVFATSGNFEWQEGLQVKCSALNDLIKVHGTPRFIKLDIEGSEAEAVRGLSWPIDRVVFEFGASLPRNMSDTVQRLEILGDYQFNYCDGEFLGDGEFLLDRWVDGAGILSAINRRKSAWGSIFAVLDDRVCNVY